MCVHRKWRNNMCINILEYISTIYTFLCVIVFPKDVVYIYCVIAGCGTSNTYTVYDGETDKKLLYVVEGRRKVYLHVYSNVERKTVNVQLILIILENTFIGL